MHERHIRRYLVSPAGSPPHISTAQLPAGRTGEPPEYAGYEGRLAGTPSGNLDPPIYATDFRRGTLADESAVRRNRAGRVAAVMALPLVLLAVLAALLGGPPFATAGSFAAALAPALWELVLSGGFAIVAVAVTWRLAHRIGEPLLLASWLGVERVAHAAVVRPVLALARLLARFDDRVLDRSVMTVARATVVAARALDRRGEGSVDGAVRAIADGTRTLGRLARRPQTGQIHQYYAQAAAALTVLALVVIVVR
jgi:NADH-quinone oxidoreductase subunit L